MARDSFIVYKSFYGLIKLLKAPQRLAMYEAIFEYGFTGEIPTFTDEPSSAIWQAILPQLKANQRRYENGLKGGAPVGNSNARKNNQSEEIETTEKQPTAEEKNNLNNAEKTTKDITEKQPNENVNENDNVNENLKVSKKENNIYKKTNTHARESYDEIMDGWGCSPCVKAALWRFIQHCQLNGQKLTNDRLNSIIEELDFKQGLSEEEQIQALDTAIAKGYFDIKRISI
ncbi:MAG: hypothetical protein IJT84_05590 [Clostridia bacterium]|nr:hypothetical protein [Clostridia bacterium]